MGKRIKERKEKDGEKPATKIGRTCHHRKIPQNKRPSRASWWACRNAIVTEKKTMLSDPTKTTPTIDEITRPIRSHTRALVFRPLRSIRQRSPATSRICSNKLGKRATSATKVPPHWAAPRRLAQRSKGKSPQALSFFLPRQALLHAIPQASPAPRAFPYQ